MASLVYRVGILNEAGMLHCDIKPANLVTVGGVVKIIDLGIAGLIENFRLHRGEVGST